MPPLREQLQSVGYRMSEGLEAQVLGALNARPCAGSFLTGPAGAGKTFLAEAVAQVQERDTYFFQAFPGCRKEELFQTFLPDADQPSGFRLLEGVLPQAARASKAAPTALILDEWDKTHPSTDAFLLDFLQSGRISIPGSRIVANQANLLVFVTLNDERELSEPLMRRLPLIELQTPPLALVTQALRDTHAEHPYLGAALALYQRGQMVNLTKPVTIQELRQLLDAITHLGRRADWNVLVFQFVTKNWDDHEMLKSAESLPMDTEFHGLGRDQPVLDPSRYESGHLRAQQAGDAMPQMPGVRREWLDKIPTSHVEADAARVFGVVPRTDSGYDGVARAVLSRNEHLRVADPSDLELARVGEHEIIVFKPLEFERAQEWGLILKDGGELLLETEHEGQISQEMLQAFKAGTMQQAPDDPDRCRIYSMTHSELLLRYRGIKVRWTPQKLEVVTRDLAATREFWEYLFGSQGVVTRNRHKLEQLRHEQRFQDSLPPNEKLREDYLYVLREYKHLRHWFDLLLKRNLQVWERITCSYRDGKVHGSPLFPTDFDPDNENPGSKEEVQAIVAYATHTAAAKDYYATNLTHIEAELTMFVGKSGELPPAVEDGGIFGEQEFHTDLVQIKREGLKLYRRATGGDA